MRKLVFSALIANFALAQIANAAPARGYFFDLFGSDNFLANHGKCFTSLMGPACVSGVKIINPQIIMHKGRYLCNKNLPLPNGMPAKELSPYGEAGGKVYKCTAKGWILSHW